MRELENRRQLPSSDFTKYQFPCSTKIFITKKLTSKNETLAFHGRTLKCKDHIFFSYPSNGMVPIKKFESSLPTKILNLNVFRDLFPDVFKGN